MKTLALLLTMLSLLSGVVTGFSTYSAAETSDGNHLLSACGALIRQMDTESTANTENALWCLGYIDGFVHGLDEMAAASSKTFEEYKKGTNSFVCAPPGSTIGQDVRIVVKYLNDHPEQLHEDEGSLTFLALTKAFPCAAKPAPAPTSNSTKK